MRANSRYRVFGSYDQEDIEEKLPLVLEAGRYDATSYRTPFFGILSESIQLT